MQEIDFQTLCHHRRALHRIAELGYALTKTNQYLRAQLSAFDCSLLDVASSGLLALFDHGSKHTLALRADMDALAIQERNELPYASCTPGIMHACGHDAHMAMLLSLCDWLQEHHRALPFNVMLIFQPAEENGAGGHEVCESGLLKRFGVDRVLALHVDPSLPLGTIASRPGPIMARASEVEVCIHGRSAHAARAHEGVDAMRIGAQLLLTLCEMEQTAFPADVRRLLHFGTFQSGTAQNAVSAQTMIRGTLRAYDDDVFARLVQTMQALAAQAEREHPGSRIKIDFSEGYPPVCNDPAFFAQICAAIPVTCLEAPYLLADDFGFYQQTCPGVYMMLGLGTGVSLHSDTFDVPDDALRFGVEAYRQLLSHLPASSR